MVSDLTVHSRLSKAILFILNSRLKRTVSTCSDPKSFVRGGPALTFFVCLFFFFFFYGRLFVVLVYEGREDPNTITLSGPSSTRQGNAI